MSTLTGYDIFRFVTRFIAELPGDLLSPDRESLRDGVFAAIQLTAREK